MRKTPVTRRAALAAALALAASAAGCSAPRRARGLDARAPGLLDGMSWAELAGLSAEIAAAPDDASAGEAAAAAGVVGADGLIDPAAYKTFELADSTPCAARVVGIRHDRAPGGGLAGLTFWVDSPIAYRGVTDGEDVSGGWEDCGLRSWLAGDALGMLPGDLAGLLRPALKRSAATGGAVVETEDALWLPSEAELAGEQWVRERYPDPGPYLDEGSPYRYFSERAADPAALQSSLVVRDGASGAWQGWWERTVAPGGDGFLFRWSTGAHTVAIDCAPNFELGVVPCFCL